MTSHELGIVDLNAASTEYTIGGKAENLRKLAAVGMPVPSSLVIPAEADDGDLARLSAEIAERFTGSRLAVRSSCIAEDRSEESFAGQYETVLNVPSEATAVLDAARIVRSSAGADRVGSYAGAHSDAMAVLVMPMVDADLAGVAFTRDPVTGERCVLIESVRGLGDRLAAGEAVGERWRVSTTTEQLNDLGVLTPVHARAIAELARRCEQAMECPQDIEWAIAGGEVVLLQSRPITTVDDVDPIPMNQSAPPGSWEWDWSHSQLPMTPLTSTAFTAGFERASRRLAETYGVPISHIEMRTINGYIYIQVVPLVGKPGQRPPPKPILRALFHVVPAFRKRLKAAGRAASERVDRQLLTEWRTTIRPRTEEILNEWYDLDRRELSDPELVEALLSAVDLQRETFSWNMNTDPAYLFPLAELHAFVAAELDGGMDITMRLLAGASPSEYHASGSALADGMPQLIRAAVASGGGREALDQATKEAFDTHQRAYGHRVIGFDLSNPTHLEDPDRELARFVTMPKRTDASVGAAELATSLKEGLDESSAQRFDSLLAEARSAYPIREEGESVHARVMGTVRLFALEVGDRMVASTHLMDRDHVVFLELEEVVGWLEEATDFRNVVRERRGQYLWARGHSPDLLLGPEDSIPPLDVFPPDIQRVMEMLDLIQTHDSRPPDLADGQDGVAASPGTHVGPARLIEDPSEFHRVQVGDVLIAPLTTSPWEILFPHIGALVTEGGGLLSHPAIVAREYALPAVVGCEGAMTRFHDGQLVRVDGAAGTVTPIESN